MDIVCLHGMGRTRFSMFWLAGHLRKEGHRVHLFGYQRRASLSSAAALLAGYLRGKGLAEGGPELGFVGHSAGGVLLRYLAAEMPDFRAGRSVALGSPIAGSVLAEHYAKSWFMKAYLGPIFQSLHPEEVSKLPLPPCQLGAIAGTAQTVILPAAALLKRVALGQASDATVLVEETRLEGICDWTSLPVVHTMLPLDRRVHALVSRYLSTGSFAPVLR